MPSPILDAIKAVAPIAAPASLAITCCLFLFRKIVAKSIFPKLERRHAFIVVMTIICCFSLITVIAIAAWAFTPSAPKETGTVATTPPPNTTATESSYPPLTMDALKNMTYHVGGDTITLQDGRRQFIPGTKPLDENTVDASLTDHAFGDLVGNGSRDAIAVIDVSDGGSGIYSYLVPVINEKGAPRQLGNSYILGDRVAIRSVSIQDGIVEVGLLMHGPNDGLCCASEFRTLRFSIRNKRLMCDTEPCSEVPEANKG